MALANYSDLLAAVALFTHRSDLTSVLPDLVNLAETRINGDLDSRKQDVSASLSTVAATETVALPTDLIEIRHCSVSSTTPKVVLDNVTLDNLYETNAYGLSGIPQKYSIVGTNLILSPTPDAVYTLKLVYRANVPSLATNSTNWLMTAYPKVYLYATLLEVAIYTKEQDRLEEYSAAYRGALATVAAKDWCSGGIPRVRTDANTP